MAHLKNALFSLGLTLSGPDVPACAPEGREGQSQEAEGPPARSRGPPGPYTSSDSYGWSWMCITYTL